MKPLEFDTQVLPDGTLRIPASIANELAPDTRVHVVVIPAQRDPEAARKGIESTFGAWKNDPSIAPIFEQIERDRQNDLGRPVELP